VLGVDASPASVATGDPATFTATTSDPDLGDAVTVAWSFDDGASAAGAQATHAFTTGGTHSATATATDSAGVATVRTATLAVTEKGSDDSGGGQGGSAPAKLVLDGLAVSPARFTSLKSGPGLIARATPAGAKLYYRVSRDATVKFTIKRLLPGRGTAKSCRKPSRKNRGSPACTRAVPVAGSLSDTAPAGGTRQLRFTGRVGSKRLGAGSYSLDATASAGSESSTAKPVRFAIARR
jgi:PKD repeat protein